MKSILSEMAMIHENKNIIKIGIADHRYRPQHFGMYQDDRILHTYIVGQTGTGKSTLMLNMIRQDMQLGNGFCLVDPHGDLAEIVTDEAAETSIYWNPADPECRYGYNPLTFVSDEYRSLVASGLIHTLKTQWSDAWGVRMEHLLRYTFLALLEQPRASIQDVVPMFLDDEYRARILERVSDPAVQKFWRDEFKALKYKTASDAVAPIANKLGAFLSQPQVRKVLCDPDEPIRFRTIMDDGGHLIVNLAKGRLGADIANVLGGLITTSIAHAAYTRHSLTEQERRPFFLYVDEFHSFTTEAFADLLAELRKYGLGLVLAHQHTSQLSKPVLDAILGNVGSIFVFRVGAPDARTLARQFHDVDAENLLGQENYKAFARIMVDGVQSKTFTLKTLPVH